MKFEKYPSLINHYKIGDIQWWLDTYPQLQECTYILTEKIDGANFQIVYEDGQRQKFGKRNSFIGDESDFFNFQEAIKDNDDFFAMNTYFETLSRDFPEKRFIVYGELYGQGINGRIYYGPGRYLKFYDVKEDENFWSAKETFNVISKFNLYPPIIAHLTGFNYAITFSNIFPSYLTPEDWNGNKEENFGEGFVLKPFEINVQNNTGSRFVIKSKNPKFADKTKVNKKGYKPMEGSLKELADAAKTYVTENRLIDLISKLGPLTDYKQIGEYMKAFQEDWQEEFRADYMEELSAALAEYSKNDIQQVYKIAGKDAIKLIKNYIETQHINK